jgi:hypothetical protein
MAVIIAAEALFYSADTVVELALIYIAIPHHSSVDDRISRFGVYEFNDYRGYTLKSSFLS